MKFQYFSKIAVARFDHSYRLIISGNHLFHKICCPCRMISKLHRCDFIIRIINKLRKSGHRRSRIKGIVIYNIPYRIDSGERCRPVCILYFIVTDINIRDINHRIPIKQPVQNPRLKKLELAVILRRKNIVDTIRIFCCGASHRPRAGAVLGKRFLNTSVGTQAEAVCRRLHRTDIYLSIDQWFL